jgi:UPF0755 protein
MKFVAALFAIVVVFFGFQIFRFLSAGPGSANEEIVFDVPPGKTFHAIADQLEKKGLVTSAFNLRVLARLTHQGGHIKTGEYALNRAMTPQEVLGVLVSGKSLMYPITFPEGSNIYDMAAAVDAKKLYKAEEFLKLVHDRQFIRELLGIELSSLEGYLFPETYNVTRYTPLRELIANMVQNFKSAYQEAEGTAKSAGLPPSMPKHDLVILASMVEKETGAPEERPMIASVFYNRLKKGMRLQSDPTIIYGIWVDTGSYKNNITKEDILHPTRYNTYTVPKLPFGPISNPGRESLLAVMKPAHSEYLYFVSHNDGTHAFSKTYEEHARAVKNFQLNPAAREGKSWRDLKKRAGTAAPAAAKDAQHQ